MEQVHCTVSVGETPQKLREGKQVIFNIQRFSLHDGDGVRTVVFFKGCPLRCAWCSNPEGQAFRPEFLFAADKCIGCRDCSKASHNGEVTWREAGGPAFDREAPVDARRFARLCPAEALTVAGEDKTADEILAEVEKDRVFYRGRGGVTLSGGEPFARPELAAEILAKSKARGLATAVETCLAVPWRNIEPGLPYLDAIYADVKHVDPAKYRTFTGGDPSLPPDNLRRLAATGVRIAARVPVIPGFNDKPEELDAIARFVAGLDVVKIVHLMPYHSFGAGKYRLLERDYPMAGVPATPPEVLTERGAALGEKFGLEVIIGG